MRDPCEYAVPSGLCIHGCPANICLRNQPKPGDTVQLLWTEMERQGLVVAVTDLGVHVEVEGTRARMVVLPPSMVAVLE